jgi:scyllo-inositol 2-dehydrogenase (NADP+)
MTTPIKLGLVGLGRAGWGMHCPELAGKSDRFQIVAACDVMPERRQAMAEQSGCRTYATIDELIADHEVELVDIATRSVDHFAHAALALQAGKHVFLEKPMCMDFDEASRLRALAAQSTGDLYVRHNRRFERAFRHISEIIQRGLLGEIQEIKLRRCHFARRDDWQTLLAFGGGQLLNWGPHIVDHAVQLLESPIAAQWSALRRVAAVGDAEDHLKIVLTGENGRIVDLEISGGAALTPEPEYLVWGTRGALQATGDTIKLRYLDPAVDLSARPVHPETPEWGSFGSADSLVWKEEELTAAPTPACDMASIWDALYLAIRDGVPFPITLDDAVENMRVISQARVGTAFVVARASG